MTSYQDKIRTKLSNKVFSVIGKTVTFKKKNTPTYNSRGEIQTETYTETTETVVPYNIMSNTKSYEAFGELNSGDMDIAVPYTVNVSVDDEFYFDEVTWKVMSVEKNFLPDNVVSIVRVTKKQ